MWHTYYTPTTLRDTLRLLAQHGSDARIIAGGTDILIELERKIRTPQVLIDISHIPGFDRIEFKKGAFHLGPLVTHNQVVASPQLGMQAYPLARACWEVGAPQIRNRGTIAGNLITASPANDTITPLRALNATVTLRSVRGQRTVPLHDFYKGVRKTIMAADELLVDICFPALSDEEHGTFIKLGLRRAQAISVVNTAVILEFHCDAIVKARLAYGSVAPTIVRAPDVERYLVGKSLTDEVIQQAGELAQSAANPIDDVRSSADYRVEMLRVLTMRALRQIRDGAERADWPAQPPLLWGKTNGHFPAWPEPQVIAHHENGPETIETTVNGRRYSIRNANDKTLLRMLREDVGLIGTKEGCAEGECGACTVFLDGIAVMACMVAAPRAHGAQIETIEGLAHDGQLHPVQEAFVKQQAVQCGYCTPGFVMAGAKLLEEIPHPTNYQI
ncbi:MAG TPA: FAD binding domain-containing protein, partial [Anaerolineae bacterium]|nr:FAD binding domain-containing protein [Anaerolineae bacterium]